MNEYRQVLKYLALMARTKRLSNSNIIRPLCGLIYGEYLTLVLDVTTKKI
jgi:hypothetical protein